MSVKNDPPKNQAEIGEALVAALGFEPTDSGKLGRSSGKGVNGSNSSKNDGKESTADTIIVDSSADGSLVAKADSTNTESKKSVDADSGASEEAATDRNGSTGTASRSSSKSRSRKKSKKTSSSGAYESKQTRASKMRSTLKDESTNDKASEAAESTTSNTATSRNDTSSTSDTSTESDSENNGSTKNKNSDSASADVTSPINVATQTRKVSTLPPPPTEDSIRTPGLGEVEDVKPSGKTDTADVETDSKVDAKADSKQDSKADAKADSKQDGFSKVATETPVKKSKADRQAKNVSAEAAKPAPVAEADFTPPTSPVVATPSADTEVLPTVPATIEPNVIAPTAPPAAPVAEVAPAPVAETSPVEPRPRTISRPDIPGPSFFGGRRKVQARKVRRVVRHIDPWSVLIFSVLFHLCIAAALLIASVLVWNAAEAAGTIEQIEDFIRELGDYETFVIDGETIFRAAVGIAGVMTLASSVLLVLLTVMFNLISDLVGGIRVTVIEEETIRVKRK